MTGGAPGKNDFLNKLPIQTVHKWTSSVLGIQGCMFHGGSSSSPALQSSADLWEAREARCGSSFKTRPLRSQVSSAAKHNGWTENACADQCVYMLVLSD